MRLIKAFLIGATGLFIIITLLSLLIPSKTRVNRTVLIDNGAKDKIYAQVYELQNWKNWHPSFAPGLATVNFGKLTAGVDGSCDIIYNNKTINLRITKTDTSIITFTLSGNGENDIINQIHFQSANGQQTRVDWDAVTLLHWYPWDKFYAIFIDKLTGPGYETALNGLKHFMEGK
jgi:hypothetical protein